MDINKFKNALHKVYSKDLCYHKLQRNWSKENPTLGMCGITTLLVKDYFGGEIYKTYVNGHLIISTK